MPPSPNGGTGSDVPIPAPGSDVATISRLFEVTFYVFGVNTEGVDAAGALQAPGPGGNCMSWVVGHLLNSRNGILGLLGQDPIVDPARLERYKRGTDAITGDGDDVIAWEELTRDFVASQERLRAGFAAATPTSLAAALPEGKNPFDVESVGQALAWLHFHESYHLGQLGILRRLIGKDGAIK